MKKRYYLIITLMALFAQPLHAQTCRNDITSTTPTQDFTIHDDGTVTHNKTGLMWMRCALGQNWNGATCTGAAQAYTWQAALQAAVGSSFAGYRDWRLPNFKELASIVEQACINPAINATVFPATLNHSFWSASRVDIIVTHAWVVRFNDGSDDGFRNKVDDLHVRLVRGGQ